MEDLESPVHNTISFFPTTSTIPPLTSDHPFKMSADELIRVEGDIVWEKEYKLSEAEWQILAYPGNGNGQKTHAAVCGDVKVSLTKQTTVVRYAAKQRELTFVLPRDVQDEELAEVKSILSGMVHCVPRDTAKEASPTRNMGLKNLAIGGLIGGGVVAATPFALGMMLGITAVGPTAGGLFAAAQSAGWVTAGSLAAAAQSTAMAGVATVSVVGGSTVGASVGALINGQKTHVTVCGDVKVSLTKQTTVVRYAAKQRELTFVLPRDVQDEELAAVESILSGLVHRIARDAAAKETSHIRVQEVAIGLVAGAAVAGASVAAAPLLVPVATVFAGLQLVGIVGGVASAQSTAMAGVAIGALHRTSQAKL